MSIPSSLAPVSHLRPGRRRRLIALAVAAGVAFVAGVAIGGAHEPGSERAAKAFLRAWEKRDYPAMYAHLGAAARSRTEVDRFARAYIDAAKTLTLAEVEAGDPRSTGDGVEADVTLRTRTFGRISGTLTLPVAEDDGVTGIDWRPHQVFPGLAPGLELERSTELPTRGTILARDGTVLARGAERESEAAPEVALIAGTLGPIPEESAADYAARGIPPDAQVGLTGLEREFDAQLLGTPGGELRAGGRLIARAEPRQAEPVESTIDPAVQSAAVAALAGRFGGIAVLVPDTGEVLALAGVAFSAPQPPGSTFKIVTLAGALDAGVTKPSERFPVQTATTLSGVELQNANGESCGGRLRQTFAHSCNSVFAPLGAELGAERLVSYAEAFGFNEEPSLLGAQPSTLPPAEELGDDLGVGSHAIGQGRALATPVEMASVAATIAHDGVRMRPTLERGERDEAGQAIPAPVAHTVGRFMRAVVTEGTGRAAALPGVRVAGKTGTAELRTTQGEDADAPPGEEVVDDTADTTAWFVAFAPAAKPRVAVAVMLVGAGAGGDTAAPAAAQVLPAALRATR